MVGFHQQVILCWKHENIIIYYGDSNIITYINLVFVDYKNYIIKINYIFIYIILYKWIYNFIFKTKQKKLSSIKILNINIL